MVAESPIPGHGLEVKLVTWVAWNCRGDPQDVESARPIDAARVRSSIGRVARINAVRLVAGWVRVLAVPVLDEVVSAPRQPVRIGCGTRRAVRRGLGR